MEVAHRFFTISVKYFRSELICHKLRTTTPNDQPPCSCRSIIDFLFWINGWWEPYFCCCWQLSARSSRVAKQRNRSPYRFHPLFKYIYGVLILRRCICAAEQKSSMVWEVPWHGVPGVQLGPPPPGGYRPPRPPSSLLVPSTSHYLHCLHECSAPLFYLPPLTFYY